MSIYSFADNALTLFDTWHLSTAAALLSLSRLTIPTYSRFTNKAVASADYSIKVNPEQIKKKHITLGLNLPPTTTPPKKPLKERSEGRRVCTKVVLLAWERGVSRSQPLQPLTVLHCARLPGTQLQPRTWPRLFTVPPSVKRVMLSVLNGQRFSLCAPIKTGGQS